MSFDQLIDAREQIRAGVALLMDDDAGYDARVKCVNDLGASADRYLSALRSCCEMMFAADDDDTRADLAMKLRAAIDSESVHYNSSFIPDAVTDPESMVRLIEYVTWLSAEMHGCVSDFKRVSSRIAPAIDEHLPELKNEVITMLLNEYAQSIYYGRIPYYDKESDNDNGAGNCENDVVDDGDGIENGFPADSFVAQVLEPDREAHSPENFTRFVEELKKSWKLEYTMKHRGSFPEQLRSLVSASIQTDSVPKLFKKLATIDASRRAAVAEIERRYTVEAAELFLPALREGSFGREDLEGLGSDDLAGVALCAIPYGMRGALIRELADRDKDLDGVMKRYVFLFEELPLLDDRSIQKLLREIDALTLARALFKAGEDVCEAIYRNMSMRAGKLLREDIEFMGPIPPKVMYEAQEKITDIVVRLIHDGDIYDVR